MKYRNIRVKITSRYTVVWVSNNVTFLGNTIEHNLCIKYLFKATPDRTLSLVIFD